MLFGFSGIIGSTYPLLRKLQSPIIILKIYIYIYVTESYLISNGWLNVMTRFGNRIFLHFNSSCSRRSCRTLSATHWRRCSLSPHFQAHSMETERRWTSNQGQIPHDWVQQPCGRRALAAIPSPSAGRAVA